MKKEKCKKEVWSGFYHHPCPRNAVKDGYCRQHHPDKVAGRERLSNDIKKIKWKNSPLSIAMRKIKELEKENDELKKQLNEIYYP